MSERTDRFHRRRALQASYATPRLIVLPPPEALAALEPLAANSDLLVRLEKIDEPVNISVSRAEVEALLKKLSDDHERKRLDQMLDDCKKGVVGSIAGAFGVGRVKGIWDKTGGNVDTVHNARSGVWANSSEQKKYESRGEYNKDVSEQYHKHDNYKNTNKTYSKAFKHGSSGVKDAYTGQAMKKSAGDKMNLDHVISAKRTHDDGAIYLAGLDPKDVANRSENLRPTNESVNKSKGQKLSGEYLDDLHAAADARRSEIERLQAKRAAGPLTDEERKGLNKLTKQESVQDDLMNEAHNSASKDREKLINRTYYGSRKFATNALKTSAMEGGKVALQQVIGEVIAEFFSAAIDEVGNWHKSSLREVALRERLQRVAKRVTSRWKSYRNMAFQGLLSGFLSSLATIVANMIATTQKRLVRMIREGVLSLFRAMQLVLFPPEGMTFRQSLHEASKLAFAGAVVVGGVVLEELLLRKLQVMGLGFVADLATAVIVGSLTAVVTALTAYSLDKLDLFGVIAEAKAADMQKSLTHSADTGMMEAEQLLIELQNDASMPT